MSIQGITQAFRRLAEITEEIGQTQSKLDTLRAERADIFLYLRKDEEQTWVSIADAADLDYKRVIEIANKRDLYLLKNPKSVQSKLVTELSEDDLNNMRRRLEELQ